MNTFNRAPAGGIPPKSFQRIFTKMNGSYTRKDLENTIKTLMDRLDMYDKETRIYDLSKSRILYTVLGKPVRQGGQGIEPNTPRTDIKGR